MESEKVRGTKELLEEEILIATSFDDKLRRVSTKFLQDILTLINELESENERLLEGNYQKEQDFRKAEKRIAELLEENSIIKSNPPIIAGRSVGKTIRAKLIDYDKLKQSNKSLEDRITELEKENKDYYDRLNNLQTYIDNHEEIWKVNTKSQLKQFAERLKIECVNKIHETLKEFINEHG